MPHRRTHKRWGMACHRLLLQVQRANAPDNSLERRGQEEAMRNMRCTRCGEEASVSRGTYRFVESGLSSVVLSGIEIARCQKCGNEDPIIPHANELMRLLASAVICKPCRLHGADVRFLRKYTGRTGKDFAKLLDLDPTTLSKWERGHWRPGPGSDRLVRLVALALGEGLEKELKELVSSTFPRIKDPCQDLPIKIDPENMSYQYA